jgi:hypothetical protein
MVKSFDNLRVATMKLVGDPDAKLLFGASRTIGGTSRGKALGNTPNMADMGKHAWLSQVLVADFFPQKIMLIFLSIWPRRARYCYS